MNKINENIKRIRVEKNLTQQEVADQIYVTRQCISRWEQGITLPDINSIERLAEVFECKVNDIIDNDSIKAITIVEAIKNKKTKKIIFSSVLISLLAIMISLAGFLLLSNKNHDRNNKNQQINNLRAIVLETNEEKLDLN